MANRCDNAYHDAEHSWDLWKLAVSADGRSIVRADGSPFFWLADTAWDLFFRLDREDIRLYMKNRADKGFTVIQAVAVMGYHVPFNRENIYGDRPFVDGDPLHPDVRKSDNYWTHVDFVFDTAHRYGMYIALLPVWGAFICEADPLFSEDTLSAYMTWIANRYKDRSNIIWVNGGDADLAFHNYEDVQIWDTAGATLRHGDANHLITYHPRGGSSSSENFHDSKWLDFNTFQTGHANRYAAGDCVAQQDWEMSPAKPTLDSESCYEQHPINWNFENGCIDDNDIRRAIYGALTSGACGHTYGHVNMWIFHRPEENEPELESVQMPHNLHWKEELNSPGVWQLQHAKALFLCRPFLTRRPAQELLLDTSAGQRALLGDGFLIAYSPCGNEIHVDVKSLPWNAHTIWWYDPRTGASTPVLPETGSDILRFTPPGVVRRGNDWVLVVDDKTRDYSAPGGSPL